MCQLQAAKTHLDSTNTLTQAMKQIYVLEWWRVLRRYVSWTTLHEVVLWSKVCIVNEAVQSTKNSTFRPSQGGMIQHGQWAMACDCLWKRAWMIAGQKATAFLCGQQIYFKHVKFSSTKRKQMKNKGPYFSLGFLHTRTPKLKLGSLNHLLDISPCHQFFGFHALKHSCWWGVPRVTYLTHLTGLCHVCVRWYTVLTR